MKTRFLKNILFVLFLFISVIVKGEDFATIYFHDGTHKKIFLKELYCLTVSKTDLNNNIHNDYQTQLIETSDGTYLQDISKIDSIVFSQEKIHFPNTEEEIDATIDLSHQIAVRTNQIVDSLKAIGLSNPISYVQEFMKMPDVIDAEISDNNSCITILRSDSILHDFILDYWTVNNYFNNIASFLSRSDKIENTRKFIPKKTDSHAYYNHNHDDQMIVKEIKNVLILAPFEDLNEEYLLDDFCESIRNCLHVEPHLFIGELADITKFKGSFLDGYDLVVFMTHGGESNTGTRLLSGSTMSKQKKYWKEAIKDGVIPELRTGTPEGHNDDYLEMTTKFLDNAHFNNSFILAFACSSADRAHSSPSLMKTFLDKGAAYYCGFAKPSKTGVVSQFGQKGALLSLLGMSLQDAYDYLKDQELVKYINNQWIQYGVQLFNFTQEDIDAFSLSLFDYEAKSKQCYMKNAFPFSLNSNINKEVVKLSWDSDLVEEELVFQYPDLDKEIFEYPKWEFKIRYDVYLNDIQIASNLYDNYMWWEINMNGTNKWYVVAKVINKTTNEVIATYNSNEAYFTYDNNKDLQVATQSLTLEEGEKVSFTITSGNGSYTVKSDKDNVATAYVKGNEVFIEAISEGNAVITITDTKTKQTADVAVKVIKKVADLQLSATKLSLVEGNSGTVEITAGSSEYGVTNLNSDKAKATLKGTTITIQALAAGEAKVVVTDMKTGQKIIIEVTVTQKAADLQLSSTKLSLVEGNSGTVKITAGSGEYGVTNLNSDKAKATLQGTTITIEALAVGEAKVVVTDMKTGQKIIIEVTVTQKTTYPDIALSTQEIHLNVGEIGQIEITSGSGNYTTWIYDTKVAELSLNGNIVTVKALALGRSVARITDNTTNKFVDFGIVVEEPSAYDKYAVDLGLSVKWAKMNVGAVSIEDCGEHYAWGETESKSYFSWSSYDYCNGNESTITKYNAHDGKTTLEPSDDAATVIMGRNWRTPTLTEMEELVNRCQWTPETLNGVNGVRVTGPNGNSIFLPYGGEMFDDVLSHDGAVGYYYASTLSSEGEKYAPALVCLGNKPEFVNYARYYGLSIRPVFNKK